MLPARSMAMPSVYVRLVCKDALTPYPNGATLLDNVVIVVRQFERDEGSQKVHQRGVTKRNLKIDELIIVTVTQVLISLIEGDAENGEAFYEQAIGFASKDKANRGFVEIWMLYRIRGRALIGAMEMSQVIRFLEELANRTSGRVAYRVA